MRFGSTSKLASQWKLCHDQGRRPRFDTETPVRLVGWLVGKVLVGFGLTLGRLVGWEHVGCSCRKLSFKENHKNRT